MAQEKLTATQLLFPVSLLAFVLMVFLGFQTTLLVSDHNGLKQAQAQQNKPVEEVTKLKAQVTALAMGTLKLADSGDKNAKTIIDNLKKAGVNVGDQATSAAPAATPEAPVPAPAPAP